MSSVVSRWSAVGRGCHNFLRHRDIPGYQVLPWPTRWRLNLQALGCFVCSGSCLRLAAYLVIWQLAAQLLVWQYDLRGPAAALPATLASLWVLPWVATKRRQYINTLLQHRWPD